MQLFIGVLKCLLGHIVHTWLGCPTTWLSSVCLNAARHHASIILVLVSNKICLVSLRLRGVRVLRPFRAPISLTTTSSQAEMSEVFIFPHASRVRLKIKLLKAKSPSAWTVHPSLRMWLHRVDAGPHFVFFGRASMRIRYPTVS